MANKKFVMSVTASAFIAAALFGAEETKAATHKVQGGETLWSIAQKYGTSVSTLKSINNLSSEIIYPNQIIETSNVSTPENVKTSSTTVKAQSISVKPVSTGTTYTVKAGDTLSKIASKHNISLKNLMEWNNLKTTLIYPGNVLKVTNNGNAEEKVASTSSNKPSSTNKASKAPAKKEQQKTAHAIVYTVKSGDTLSRIGREYGVSVADLKKWNNLKSDTIYIGQKLNIGGTTGASSNGGGSVSTDKNVKPADVNYNVDKLVSVARSVLGTPYSWAGTTPNGFDCSGFIYYAYRNADMNINRQSTQGYFDRSYYVNKPQVGDLVFFAGTYKSGISHMGIYIGDNRFIHAGTSEGVTISNLDSGYWKKHFDSFKRFY